MKTAIQKIKDDLYEFKTELIEFLKNYSGVKQTIFRGDGFFSMAGNFSFDKLPEEAITVQDKLFKEFNKLVEIINILLINSTKENIRKFKDSRMPILANINQDSLTWNKSIEAVISDCVEKVDEIVKMLELIYPNNIEKPILIPDTNAFYHNTDIEKWRFADFDKFTIILTPSVLKELDGHKILHKNEDIRKKAKKIINKIKDYRNRGKLTTGVTIVKDKIDLKSIGLEPDFEKTINFLDKNNEDDRLIASTLEIIRENCERPVLLVSTDINLQNKCDVFNLAYIEPPEES